MPGVKSPGSGVYHEDRITNPGYPRPTYLTIRLAEHLSSASFNSRSRRIIDYSGLPKDLLYNTPSGQYTG